MKKKFSSLLLLVFIPSLLFLSGCWLDPNFKNCREAIKQSWLLYNYEVASFRQKDWYIEEYPAKIMVWTNITYYDIDVPWWAPVACITSNPWTVQDNWGYSYEAVLILWKDPTLYDLKQYEPYFRNTSGGMEYYNELMEEFWWENLRFKMVGTGSDLIEEASLNIIANQLNEWL